MVLADHHRGSLDRSRRDGSELFWMVIALMLSCTALHPYVELRTRAGTRLDMASRHMSPGSGPIVPALASPRPLTAVCS